MLRQHEQEQSGIIECVGSLDGWMIVVRDNNEETQTGSNMQVESVVL